MSKTGALLCLYTAVVLVDVSTSSDFYYDNWKCNHYMSAENIKVAETERRLLELHIRDNIQGEVEIKDADSSSSHVWIEVEKFVSTEMQRDFITVNQTLFDVGHGSIFLLQLDYVPRAKRRTTFFIGITVGGSVVLVLSSLVLYWYHKEAPPPPTNQQSINSDGSVNAAIHGRAITVLSDASNLQSDVSYRQSLDEGGDDQSPTSSHVSPRHLTTVANHIDTVYDVMSAATNLSNAAEPSAVFHLPKDSRDDVTGVGGDVGDVRDDGGRRYTMARRSWTLGNCSDNGFANGRRHTVDRCHSRLTSGGVSKACLTMTVLLSVVTVVVYANCHSDPLARIIVFIPPAFRLCAVKLFFRQSYQNVVVTDRWFNKNDTFLQIFDLQTASQTSSIMCAERRTCTVSTMLSLKGCDSATNSAVCERGYGLDRRGTCVDINECLTPFHTCPPTATCQNIVGSYLCHCGYGFYGNRKSCDPCSFGCPPGQYESAPCSAFADRVCIPCTKCLGSTYEAKPCGGSSDSQCIHAAHPLVITGDMTIAKYLDELQTKQEIKKRKRTQLKVDMSTNVFAEDLHVTRNLSTTYYVTDTTQAFDFSWERESGLKINVGILDVHMIPEYVDVDHDGDNKYMLSDPNSSEEKTKFNQIVREYCRNPIPDYYRITLEIASDRTTAAQMMTCDSTEPTKPKCPRSRRDGDTFLYRTPNDACQKMGTYPEPLQSADNSIVCTDQSELLNDFFNQSQSSIKPIKFPNKKCRTAMSRCEQCINQPRCHAMEIFDRRCCQLDCYTLLDCKQAYSVECTSTPVECAQGDAYRYTIQPVFENIKDEHHCHIRRQAPQVLYKLFYYIQIPGTGLRTSDVYRTTFPSSDYLSNTGQMLNDFLTVEHSSGLELQNEFILTGFETEKGLNYSLHTMRHENNNDVSKVEVHEISNKIFIASTQFEKPFDYSTSTWTLQNDCHKNVSKFRTPVKRENTFYRSVNVVIQNGAKPFRYYLQSADSPPYIRFGVIGSVSILPFFFKNKEPVLLLNNSLVATLELTSAGRFWEIIISGAMSGCPAYLGITITSHPDQEELFRYDLLIRCPADFNITFKILNRGQQPDKTFDLHLQDLSRGYDIHLIQMTFELNHVEGQSDMESSAVTAMSRQRMPMSVIIIPSVALSIVMSLVIFVIVYIYTETIKQKKSISSAEDNHRGTPLLYNAYNSTASNNLYDFDSKCRNCSTHLCNCLCYLYVVFRLIYSVAFTFTAFHIVLAAIIDDDLSVLSRLERLETDKEVQTSAFSRSIEQYEMNEISRQQELAIGMRTACSNYIDELLESVSVQIYQVQSDEKRENVANISNFSLSALVLERTSLKLERFAAEVQSYRAIYRNRVKSRYLSVNADYGAYLERLYKNNWFNFAQLLFNNSLAESVLQTEGNEWVTTLVGGNDLKGLEVEFGKFLQLQEIELLHLWPSQILQRFERQLSDLILTLRLSFDMTQYELLSTDPLANLGSSKKRTHIDSTHFFSALPLDESPPDKAKSLIVPHPPVDDTSKTRKISLADSYKLLNPATTRRTEKTNKNSLTFSIQQHMEGFTVRAWMTMFCVLDLLIFIYRMSVTCMMVRTLKVRMTSGNDWKGTSHRLVPASSKFSRLSNSRGNHETVPISATLNENNVVHNIYTQQSHSKYEHGNYLDKCAIRQSDYRNGGIGSHAQLRSSVSEKKFHPCYKVFIHLMDNSVFPKAVVISLCLLVLYGCLNSLAVFVNMQFLVGVNAFGISANSLLIQINETNTNILNHARYFNDVILKEFEKQMYVELMNVQRFLDYFNAEQKFAAESVQDEMCGVFRESHTDLACDVIITPTTLNIPVLPCNFIPIQLQLFTDAKLRDYQQQQFDSFQPLFAAANDVIIKTLYFLLLLIASMLVMHVLGSIIYRCIPLAPPLLVRLSHPSIPPNLPTDSSVQMFMRHVDDDVSDYDSDDASNNDGETGRYLGGHVPPLPPPVPPSFSSETVVYAVRPLLGLLDEASEFRYTETNV